MIKYKTFGCYDEIRQVAIDGETPGYVFIGGQRMAKSTVRCDCYFDTWDEAYSHLLKKTGEEVAWAQEQLDYAHEWRGKVLRMRKPENTTDTEA